MIPLKRWVPIQRVLFHFGNMVRETGQGIDRFGMSLQGNYAFKEQLSRHRRVMNLFEKIPHVGEGAFVAPSASVIGWVDIGQNSSVWYGAVIRGDVNSIKIGTQTSLGDRVVVHVSRYGKGGPIPTVIGDRCVVGSAAILHACTLEDESNVGMGAMVLDGAVVGKHAILEAGSVLTPGKKIPESQVWAGNPAKYVRDVTQVDLKAHSESLNKIKELQDAHNQYHIATDLERLDAKDLADVADRVLYRRKQIKDFAQKNAS